MSELKKCGVCGALIPRDAPLGNCPDCLVELGLGPPPEPLPPTTPARFGDYELLEMIGRGGMGVVYKARQTSLNRMIALKMLNPHSAAFPKVAERLRLEAEAAASLHHPNIVTIHEVGEQEGRPFFTMELVEGAGMDKFIGKTGYRFPGPRRPDHDPVREPRASAVRTLITIARAVDYAHKHGVLHRDLKPANVVVDAAG
jgi:serine/threonine-protein kinase